MHACSRARVAGAGGRHRAGRRAELAASERDRGQESAVKEELKTQLTELLAAHEKQAGELAAAQSLGAGEAPGGAAGEGPPRRHEA